MSEQNQQDQQQGQQNQQAPAGNQQQGAQQGQQNQQAPADFDTWLAGQPDEVKRLAETHTTGLKSALQSEREQRKTLATQLKEATGKLEKGSDAAKALEEISGKLELAERRASFFEEASRPDVGCANAKAAFLVAQAEGLFKKNGDVDWAALKATAPELFGRRVATANAGAGTQAGTPAGKSMNDFIRRSAGVS